VGFFLLIFALSLGGGSEAEPCFEQQLAFQDACYEAVKLQRTFRSAQGWCERGGGHLAFILRQETQEFLQKSLAAGRDWWIGLAPWKENLTQERTIAEATKPVAWKSKPQILKYVLISQLCELVYDVGVDGWI
uniref:Polycystin 1 like 2/pseudo n=1 Tax=Callorhinchus milii TaxID=7868 RepID=A0A4W3IMV0_CALMI